MHREMLNFINQEATTKGLFLLDPVTGFGKTYEAIETIYQRVFCSNNPLDGTILYVTPLLKNLNDVYDGLRKRIGDEELFSSYVMIIKSNYDCLADAFNALAEMRFSETVIPKQIVESKVYKQLKYSFHLYEKLSKEKEKDAAEKVREEIASKLDSDFRSEIYAYFRKKTEPQKSEEQENKKKERAEELKQVDDFLKEEPWVLRFYPHTTYRKSKVVLMSFAKFIRRIGTPFDNAEIIDCFAEGDSVVILDEFDATKKAYLSELLKNRIYFDAIRYFTMLYSRLKTHKFKAIDMESFGFRLLCREAEAIFSKYHLDCNYISSKDQETSYLPQKQKILFHDNYYFSPVKDGAFGRYINAFHSPKKEINEIFYSKTAQTSRDGMEKMDLPSLLSRMNYFFKDFQGFVAKSAEEYAPRQNEIRKKKSQGKPSIRELSLDEARSTIYYDFGLDPKTDRDFLEYLKFAVDKRRGKKFHRKKKGRPVIFDFAFYNKGFRYYAFKDDDSNNEITIFGFAAINRTPEKELLQVCDNYKVIGLSATALTPSFYTNYNLEFLSRELGDALFVLPEEKREEIKNQMKERFRAYREPIVVNGRSCKVDVVLNVIREPKEDLKQRLLSLYLPQSRKAVAAKYESLRIALRDYPRGNQEYYLRRYVDIFEAMQYFFAHTEIRSLLCLSMPSVGNEACFSEATFEEWFDDLRELYEEPEANYVVLRADGYANAKKRIETLVESGGRVFVMSSYATVGTGQNFTFKIPANDRENVFCITECSPEDARGRTKDFDAIFLGEMTNQLVNDIGEDAAEEIAALYEITEHYNEGNIGFYEHIEAIGDVFSHSFPYRNQSALRASSAVRIGNTANVLQAVGRITRTFCKKRQIHILVTEALLDQLDVSYLKVEQLSPEMAAIVAECKKQQGSPTGEMDRRRELNLMSVRTAEFNECVQQMTHGGWTAEKYAIYGQWNDFIFKNPTPSIDEVPLEFRHAYISDLGGRGKYYYRFHQENGNYEISFEPLPGYNFTVDEEQSKLSLLMSYPGAREHLEEKGCATSFSQGGMMLNPVAYRNLYKGRLGEEGCKFIVTREFMLRGYTIRFQQIENLTVFETFDFELAPGVFVDAKNWNDTFLKPEKAELQKLWKKMEATNAKIVFYINLSSEYEKVVAHQFPGEKKVYFVPRLLKPTGEVDKNIIKKLLEEMKRYGSCNLI